MATTRGLRVTTTRRGFGSRVVLAVTLIGLTALAACTQLPSVTVREGADPIHEDKDVAFRTTYYFRVFDYCVIRKKKHVVDNSSILVPVTDSMYRFRMTGKSNTITNDIRFEAGTLMSWEIDPFGATIDFDEETGRFHFVSQQEAEAEIARNRALDDFDRLQALYAQSEKKNGDDPDLLLPDGLRSKLETAMARRLDDFMGTSLRPPQSLGFSATTASANEEGDDLTVNFAVRISGAFELEITVGLTYSAKDRDKDPTLSNAGRVYVSPTDGRGQSTTAKVLLGTTKSDAAEGKRKTPLQVVLRGGHESTTQLTVTLTEPRPAPEARKIAADIELGETVPTLVDIQFAPGIDRPADIQCPEDAPVRRGFQIMGPEGWRTFNQDERLIMAMSSNAAPLISTLKDLAGRVLNAQARPEAVNLVLAKGRLRVTQAQQALDDALTTSNATPESIATAAAKALDPSLAKKKEGDGDS